MREFFSWIQAALMWADSLQEKNLFSDLGLKHEGFLNNL